MKRCNFFHVTPLIGSNIFTLESRDQSIKEPINFRVRLLQTGVPRRPITQASHSGASRAASVGMSPMRDSLHFKVNWPGTFISNENKKRPTLKYFCLDFFVDADQTRVFILPENFIFEKTNQYRPLYCLNDNIRSEFEIFFGMGFILSQIAKGNKTCVDLVFSQKKDIQNFFFAWKNQNPHLYFYFWMKSKSRIFLYDLFSYDIYFLITAVIYCFFLTPNSSTWRTLIVLVLFGLKKNSQIFFIEYWLWITYLKNIIFAQTSSYLEF